jgi:hypothetical protein
VRADQRHQHIEGATAEPNRLAVGKKLAAQRQDLKATERYAHSRHWSGSINCPHNSAPKLFDRCNSWLSSNHVGFHHAEAWGLMSRRTVPMLP